MNKLSENLIASFGRTVAILNTIKNMKTAKTISYVRPIAFTLSLTILPIVVQGNRRKHAQLSVQTWLAQRISDPRPSLLALLEQRR